MDISQFAAPSEAIDPLSRYQISSFFRRHKALTKDDCDRKATEIVSGRVSPTLVQGQTSYTVASCTDQQPIAVQFRDSALDTTLMSLAKQTYTDFVPCYQSRGQLTDVYIYEMDLIPGVAFCRARQQLLAPAMKECLLRTVQDFARFFALAWINKLDLEQLPDSIYQATYESYSRILDQLTRSLPSRFQPKLEKVRQGLPLLFHPDYPLVVNHDDLLEMNIHVEEHTGRITGIVDWADAKISPFGTSLAGLETILGVQTSTCWYFHSRHEYFRVQFWKTFYAEAGEISEEHSQAIEVGRLFSLFRMYGFDRRPEKENAAVLEEGDREFACLEAVCLLG